MAAPSDFGDLINKLTGGSSGNPELIWAHKTRYRANGGVELPVGGQLVSLWTTTGNPSHGAAPGSSARNPTNATIGTLKQTDPSGGRKKWLVSSHISASGLTGNGGLIVLADRLADISGLSSVSSATQTITGLSVTRYTGAAAAGNQIFLEIYTQIGITARTATVVYTNENGASKSSSVPLGGGTYLSLPPHVRAVPLAQGDKGVRSVESVTLDGTTGTVGDFGVTIFRPLLFAWLGTASVGGATEAILTGPVNGPIEIAAGAALFMYGCFTAAFMLSFDLGLQFVES